MGFISRSRTTGRSQRTPIACFRPAGSAERHLGSTPRRALTWGATVVVSAAELAQAPPRTKRAPPPSCRGSRSLSGPMPATPTKARGDELSHYHLSTRNLWMPDERLRSTSLFRRLVHAGSGIPQCAPFYSLLVSHQGIFVNTLLSVSS